MATSSPHEMLHDLLIYPSIYHIYLPSGAALRVGSAAMGDLSWGGQAITAMEDNKYQDVPMIFRARGAHVDTAVRGGCYGRLALPRRGYNPRKMGISAKTYETGDTLLHLAARNCAEPRFMTELLALGAKADLRNASGELAADIDPKAMRMAVKGLAIRPKNRKKNEEAEKLAVDGVKLASAGKMKRRRGAAFMPGENDSTDSTVLKPGDGGRWSAD